MRTVHQIGTLAALLSLSLPALAVVQFVTGKVLFTQGHENLSCRTVAIRENGTGTIYYFRIASPGSGQDSIGSIAQTATVSQLDVSVAYDPSQTSGCGTEPRIIYISLLSGL